MRLVYIDDAGHVLGTVPDVALPPQTLCEGFGYFGGFELRHVSLITCQDCATELLRRTTADVEVPDDLDDSAIRFALLELE